jgi:ComF family protein
MCTILRGFLTLLAPLRCAGCDEPIDEPVAFCDSCSASTERATLPCAVLEYGGPVADAIQRFKYEGRSELAAALGSLMCTDALRLRGEVDAVVPVPLHWRRRRARGYDQAALLAKHVAKALAVPALLRALRRVRNTPSQVDLTFRERQRNMSRAFVPSRLRGAQRVLLVDDVRTTGATIRAASEALKAGGALEVHSLALAARVLTEAT